jgi:hypothetical protein
MPKSRMDEGPLPGPPRGHASRTAILIATFTVGASLLVACGGRNENENKIAPIRASLDIAPVLDDPAVFFREHADQDPGDDLVFIDVVLRTTSPTVFDAFTLEIHFDPALVQVAGGSSGVFLDTPFGVCNEVVSSCTVPSAQDPLCVFSGDESITTGELLLGVTANIGYGCPAATASGEVKLLTLGFAAASTGTSSIDLIYNSDPMTPGDCEILNGLGDLGIPCFDGNATLSATR